jgi:hypothetical protein
MKFISLLTPTAILIFLSLGIASVSGYNSDNIYTYSQVKDIMSFYSLKGWVFSAVPFTIPDVLLSIPFAALLNDPITFYYVVSPIQILIFALIYSYIQKNQSNQCSYALTYTSIAIAISSLAIIGPLIFKSAFWPYFFTIQSFFIFVKHGSAAIAAVLAFFLIPVNVRPNLKILAVFLAFFIPLTLSNFYFAFYLSFLVFARVDKKNWKTCFMYLSVIGTVSIICFILSYAFNPSLSLQMQNTLAASGSNKSGLYKSLFLILLTPFLMVVILKYLKILTPTLLRLFVGLLLISIAEVSMGLLSDADSFRYMCASFLISTIFLQKIVLNLSYKKLKAIQYICLFLTICYLINALFVRERSATDIYKNEIACINNLHTEPMTIISEYWPAKVIFESTHRQHNLIQTNGNLEPNDWFSNTRWKSLHPNTKQALVIRDGLSQNVIENLMYQNGSEETCNGKIIVLDINNKVFDGLINRDNIR